MDQIKKTKRKTKIRFLDKEFLFKILIKSERRGKNKRKGKIIKKIFFLSLYFLCKKKKKIHLLFLSSNFLFLFFFCVWKL